ncbi:hypothetical protein [Natronorubrum sp. DTA7]
MVYDTGDWGGHNYAVHRIVGETEHGLEAKGDANGFVDQDQGELRT